MTLVLKIILFNLSLATINMINLNLKRIAQKKGIERPYTALRAIGISHGMASHYLNSHHRMLKLNDVEKICLAWHCTPNDLLEWTQAEQDANLPENHPLSVLHRTNGGSNISQLLINASPERLEEVERLLREGV